ncbi:hypothetical protein F3Y22_tig00110551pilonHSYRG00123 [Hibiscus syriacus]|uniref:C2 NT-type domain-containing protein n=1 Tax=Hibiscus syriacus TaxID=106335 RepID=A0A6A3ACK3_HIBSY|nr:hypothetical protein F3Y22_tig00110551pilonHSYRG00123 [Hibiscus syriacus]
MVVKMMRWRPWPPLVSKKYEVEVRWKGLKASLSSLRRTGKRNFTKEVDGVDENGVVVWDEEFQSLCNLSAYKDSVFHPWEIAFSALNVSSQGLKNKDPVVGTASLNLAEYASAAERKEFELNIPLVLSTSTGAAEPGPQLCILLSLLELRTTQETYESVERALVPVASSVGTGARTPPPPVLPSLVPNSVACVSACCIICRDWRNCSIHWIRIHLTVLRRRIDEVKEDSAVRNNRNSDVGVSNVEDSLPTVGAIPAAEFQAQHIVLEKKEVEFRSLTKGEPVEKGLGEGGDDIDLTAVA